MKIAISTESTVDLPKELLAKYDIHVIPFGIVLGEELRLDGDLTPDEIFDYVDKTGILPKTSAVNEFQYEEYFTDLLKDYDAIVHVSFGNKMSAAQSNARKVAEKFPNVYIFDSASLSTGIALQCIYAKELADQGLSPEAIIVALSHRVDKVQASFCVDTLVYLHKGGRCSGTSAFFGKAFNIKPQIILRDGEMIPGKKYMGKMEKVVKQYCETTIKEFPNIDVAHVFITHTRSPKEIVQIARDALLAVGVPEENIIETVAGGTITSHCGPGTLGILYYADAEKSVIE